VPNEAVNFVDQSKALKHVENVAIKKNITIEKNSLSSTEFTGNHMTSNRDNSEDKNKQQF